MAHALAQLRVGALELVVDPRRRVRTKYEVSRAVYMARNAIGGSSRAASSVGRMARARAARGNGCASPSDDGVTTKGGRTSEVEAGGAVASAPAPAPADAAAAGADPAAANDDDDADDGIGADAFLAAAGGRSMRRESSSSTAARRSAEAAASAARSAACCSFCSRAAARRALTTSSASTST